VDTLSLHDALPIFDADTKKSRSTIRVFGESIEQFRQAVNEAAASVIG
jgi:hypothetical protein